MKLDIKICTLLATVGNYSEILVFMLPTQVTLATSTMGFPRGGTLTYHLLANTKAITASTMKKAGTPNANGKQVDSPIQLEPGDVFLYIFELLQVILTVNDVRVAINKC